MFDATLYVRIYRDRFNIRHIEAGTQLDINADKPFTSGRLLVGNYTNAEKVLSEGVRQAYISGWFRVSPVILIQPMEMVEGGLSEVEWRSIRELAVSAGARIAIVWVGQELSDAEVKDKVKNRK